MAKNPQQSLIEMSRNENRKTAINEVRKRNINALKGRKNKGVSLIGDLDANLKMSTIHRNSRRSAAWLQNKLKSDNIDKSLLKDRIRVGRLYMFIYKAKGEGTKQLPYYDEHPMILPLSNDGNSFLGLNIHYLPPKARIILLQKLDKFAKGSGKQKRLQLSYQLLSGAANLPEIKPCLKRYLYSHVKSKFAVIPNEEWHLAAFMPLSRFNGATRDQVYKDSRDKMRRGR